VDQLSDAEIAIAAIHIRMDRGDVITRRKTYRNR